MKKETIQSKLNYYLREMIWNRILNVNEKESRIIQYLLSQFVLARTSSRQTTSMSFIIKANDQSSESKHWMSNELKQSIKATNEQRDKRAINEQRIRAASQSNKWTTSWNRK